MVKERVSLTLSSKLLKQLDRHVDGLHLTSRSNAVESFLEDYLNKEKFAVILAGGDSKNYLVPGLRTMRPLVKIKGKALIEHAMEKAKAIGYKNFLIVADSSLISELYKRLGEGKGLGVKIQYLEETEHLGSLHTLSLVKDRLKSTFLLLPFDHYFDFDLKTVEESHRKSDALATLAVYAGSAYTWNKTSIVEVDGNRIVKYWGKPLHAKTHLTATLIGFCEPEIFDYIRGQSGPIEANLFSKIAELGRLGACIVAGSFVNIHSKEDLEKARQL